MTLYRRTLTYVSMGNVLLAVNSANNVCGVLMGMENRRVIRNPFQEHTVNGQPKPIEQYFKRPVKRA